MMWQGEELMDQDQDESTFRPETPSLYPIVVLTESDQSMDSRQEGVKSSTKEAEKEELSDVPTIQLFGDESDCVSKEEVLVLDEEDIDYDDLLGPNSTPAETTTACDLLLFDDVSDTEESAIEDKPDCRPIEKIQVEDGEKDDTNITESEVGLEDEEEENTEGFIKVIYSTGFKTREKKRVVGVKLNSRIDKKEYSPNDAEALIAGEGSSPGEKGAPSSPPNRFAVYVGNLTYWTTHDDVRKAVGLLGIMDVVDVKIFESRANGQSKGYSLVTLGSARSLQLASDQLHKTQIHGQTPVVRPDVKSSAVYFESMCKFRPQHPSTNPDSKNISSIVGGSDNYMAGSPYATPANILLSHGPLMPTPNIRPRHPYQRGWVRGGGMTHPGVPRSWAPPNFSHRSHIYPRMPGMSPRYSAPPTTPSPYYEDWRGYTPHPHYGHYNPGFMGSGPMYQPADYAARPPNPWGSIEFNHVDNVSPERSRVLAPADRPPFFVPGSFPITPSSNYTISESHNNATNTITHTEGEDNKSSSKDQGQPGGLTFEDMVGKNTTLCSQAIQRAVADASSGDFSGAIETLVTAISLIRGSRVILDERCQVLVCSLQQSLEGIENRSYGRLSNKSGEQFRKSGGSCSTQRSPPPHGRSRQFNDLRSSNSSSRRRSSGQDRSDTSDDERILRDPKSARKEDVRTDSSR